jgi:hypothetical protein
LKSAQGYGYGGLAMADPAKNQVDEDVEFVPTMKRLEKLAAEAGPWTDEDEELHKLLTEESDAH